MPFQNVGNGPPDPMDTYCVVQDGGKHLGLHRLHAGTRVGTIGYAAEG
jgi:hypothetical protein